MANELRVRAYNLPVLTLDAAYDPSTDTTISAPELADWPVVDATNHLAVPVNYDRGQTGDPFILYITAHASGATTATVAKDMEGTTAVAVPIGTHCKHGPTVRDFAAGRIVIKKRTSSDLTVNSATWTNWDTGLDTTLEAQAGDVVEIGMDALSSTGSFTLLLGAGVWDGSAFQSFFGSGEPTTSTGNGIAAWLCTSLTNVSISGGSILQLAAADIVSGQVTVRLRARTSGSKTVAATSGAPLIVWLKNHGPRYVAPTF